MSRSRYQYQTDGGEVRYISVDDDVATSIGMSLEDGSHAALPPSIVPRFLTIKTVIDLDSVYQALIVPDVAQIVVLPLKNQLKYGVEVYITWIYEASKQSSVGSGTQTPYN